jgi:hypothetical protein
MRGRAKLITGGRKLSGETVSRFQANTHAAVRQSHDTEPPKPNKSRTKSHICPVCGRRFGTAKSLNRHRRKHLNAVASPNTNPPIPAPSAPAKPVHKHVILVKKRRRASPLVQVKPHHFGTLTLKGQHRGKQPTDPPVACPICGVLVGGGVLLRHMARAHRGMPASGAHVTD